MRTDYVYVLGFKKMSNSIHSIHKRNGSLIWLLMNSKEIHKNNMPVVGTEIKPSI